MSAAHSPAALEGEVRTRAAPRGPTPAALTPGARPRPAFEAPARAAPGFGFAPFAPRALGMAAVPAAFPRGEAPDLPALAAAGRGPAFRAAPRFAPAALLLAGAVPVAGARRAFRDAAVLEQTAG